LPSLKVDHDKFKAILHGAIHLQNDLEALHNQLQQIGLTIDDFEQATGNTDGGKSAKLYDQLQDNLEQLSLNHADFLKRCKHITDQCERYLTSYNEINHLNDDIQRSMVEFQENLSQDEAGSPVSDISMVVQFSVILLFRRTKNCNYSYSMRNSN
jgi:chromosome segregation ATPase